MHRILFFIVKNDAMPFGYCILRELIKLWLIVGCISVSVMHRILFFIVKNDAMPFGYCILRELSVFS